MITILDYGLGNIFNLQATIKRAGYDSVISDREEDILESDVLFLPGVGAFKAAMDNIKEKKLESILKKRAAENKPIVGICLGMQLLFDSSTEDGLNEGLGLIEGKIKKLDIDLKVPHMGWNELIINQNNYITQALNNGDYVYYVHSYYLEEYNKDNIIASSEYEVNVPGIVMQGNTIGLQFHPEKSGDVGLKLLTNILDNFLGDQR